MINSKQLNNAEPSDRTSSHRAVCVCNLQGTEERRIAYNGPLAEGNVLQRRGARKASCGMLSSARHSRPGRRAGYRGSKI